MDIVCITEVIILSHGIQGLDHEFVDVKTTFMILYTLRFSKNATRTSQEPSINYQPY